MNNKSHIDIFRDFDDVVRSQYISLGLFDIKESTFDTENSLSFFSRIVHSKQNLKPWDLSAFKMSDELMMISQDVRYYTSILYFLRPYIVDSTRGRYFKTHEDNRYFMFASVCFQSVYNFWDRIGDLLDIFFYTGLQKSSVYFSRVLNNFPKEYKDSDNFKWLDSNYNEKIKNLLGQRDEIVHSYQLECEYFWRFHESLNDSIAQEIIQNEKESFPELFKEQGELMIKGYEKALRLIEELPNKQ